MSKKRLPPQIEHRRFRLLPEELFAILPLLDSHSFSAYVRARLAEALRGNLPTPLPRVPSIVAALEKNTCLAIEREQLAQAKECAALHGMSLNHFLRAVLFAWERAESGQVELRFPSEVFLRRVA
jgi:hypothetical protein